MSFRENGGETRICDIMLTYCENDKEFGMKLAGEFYQLTLFYLPFFLAKSWSVGRPTPGQHK